MAFGCGQSSLISMLLATALASLGCAGHDAPARSAEVCGCSVKRACPAGFTCESGLCMPLENPAAPAAASETVAAAPAPVEKRLVLDGTEVHELISKVNGRAYQIVVAPPAKPEPGKRVATVYVLDGYWDFPLVHGMRGSLLYDEAIPDVMVVGIGYAGPSPDVSALRASDYTPTAHASRADSGHAPEFLRFIETELFPFVEAHYPSDPARRVLAGASYGGLFTLYTLFDKPELFYGYVSMTPAINWDDGFIMKRAREFARVEREPFAQRLWISFGDAEEPEKVTRGRQFMRELEAYKLQGLALRTRLIEGERHAAMKNESYNRGLRFVLAPLAAKPSK